jgi:glutamate synthase (NADPH) large chain
MSPSRRCWRCRPCTSTWCAKGLRTTAGLVVETGSAREVHHFAVLAGYGAEAVHPYLALETLARLHKTCPATCRPTRPSTTTSRPSARVCRRSCPRWACRTYMSYCGAQLFEAIGLEQDCVDKYFRGTASPIGGIGVFEIAEEAIRMHRAAFGDDPVLATMLDAGGEYAWRVRGEEHMWTPDAIAKLQHSARAPTSSRPTRNTRRSSTTRASAT